MPVPTTAPEGAEGEIKDPLPEKLQKAVVSAHFVNLVKKLSLIC